MSNSVVLCYGEVVSRHGRPVSEGARRGDEFATQNRRTPVLVPVPLSVPSGDRLKTQNPPEAVCQGFARWRTRNGVVVRSVPPTTAPVRYMTQIEFGARDICAAAASIHPRVCTYGGAL